jgi:hypothetical protein
MGYGFASSDFFFSAGHRIIKPNKRLPAIWKNLGDAVVIVSINAIGI